MSVRPDHLQLLQRLSRHASEAPEQQHDAVALAITDLEAEDAAGTVSEPGRVAGTSCQETTKYQAQAKQKPGEQQRRTRWMNRAPQQACWSRRCQLLGNREVPSARATTLQHDRALRSAS